MSTNPSTQLSRQYGIVDTLIYPNGGNSKFFYAGYTQEKNKWKEYQDMVPDVTMMPQSPWGTTSTFTMPIYADKMGPQTLSISVSAPTKTGGTFVRFTDFAPLAMINRINLRYGQNVFYTHYPQKKWWNVQKKHSEEKKDIELTMLAGQLTPADRNILASGTQTFLFDIPWPWTLSPDRYLEVRQLAISPIVEIVWNQPWQFLETDGSAATTTITAMFLKTYNIFFEPDERSVNNQICEADNGIIRLSEWHQIEQSNSNTSIPTLTGSNGLFRYQLQNLKTSLRFLAFWLLPSSVVNTNYVSTPYYAPNMIGLGGALNRWRLETGAGEVLLPWIYTPDNLLLHHKQMFNAPLPAPIFGWYWDDNPVDECNTHGAYNFQAIQNPVLVLDFGSNTTSGPTTINLLFSQWQMLQTVRGELAAQFA